MQEYYQPVEWLTEQTMHERIDVRTHRAAPRRRGRLAMARGLRRLADAIDG